MGRMRRTFPRPAPLRRLTCQQERTMKTHRAALQSGTHLVVQVGLFLAASVTPLFASGQQQSRAPNDAPPQMEKLEEGEPPAVTIPGREPHNSITETRDRGAVTSIRVESGNSTYYIKPQSSVGSALPGDVQSPTSRPAQWQILQFESGHKNDAPRSEAAPVPAPPAFAPERKQ
ncbi:MAG: hypothetical protein JWR21_657 [Herminiimonas sp.]|nr:hypothetical protein [Herminiimonas sp.]MDB5855264.1 hypothetical protein [Herminiimonas sp.]